MNKQYVSVGALLVCVSVFSSVSLASAENPAQDSSNNFLADNSSLSRNDTSLTGETFFRAWLAKDNERERMKANMYLLGVFDASEGREWCGYSKALPDTLRENVYSFFRHLPEKRLQERASSLIIESLKNTLPCDKKR